MMNSSISVKNVSKCYKIYPSRNARLKEWLIPFKKKFHEEKWVLRDISFEVGQGEAIGIIGMNGAGKSTLLKIITGTVMSTTGSVKFNGTVSALLELGLGFHPDFTGRQNVYMSGQLLGYTTEEIEQCMQEIEEFAEIGKAIDAPVRTYSSGMQVRLAFSVATMKRPDILIVDEALSVGDAYFQHKSFGRIKEFQKEGTTLLLVSHDKAAIQAVCDRAILLDKGNVIKEGEPEEIMDFYNAMIGGNGDGEIKQERTSEGRVVTKSGTEEAVITKVLLLNKSNEDVEIVSVGESCKIVIEAEVMKDIPALNCGFSIKDRLGQTCYGTNTMMHDCLIIKPIRGNKYRFEFSLALNIGEGNYSIQVALVEGKSHVEANYQWIDLAKVFQVINTHDYPFAGQSYLSCECEIKIM